jgi:hypothetical protein
MPVNETAQTRLEPNIIQIDSIGIGLYRTNDALALTSNQFLVIGEGTVENTPSLVQHNLIVDNTGIAVNASLESRDALPNRGYAVYIKGDLMVEGTIRGNEYTSNPPATIGADRLFSPVSYNVYNNIYSTHQVNISTELQARSNTHKFNIVSTPNRDIKRSQFNLQNTELSQFRMGILGNASNSPVVFNTPSNVPIEFHVGRDQTYFSNIYTEAINGNPNNLIARDVPIYNANETSNLPHMIIDRAGNVGIRTSQTETYSYRRTAAATGDSNYFYTETVRAPMSLQVNGPAYGRELLVYDVVSRATCNIDTLYVRSLGLSFDPNQVRPGTFSHGTYIFTSNVLLTLPTAENETALDVLGNTTFHCNVRVDETLFASNLTGSGLTVSGESHFTDTVRVDTMLYASNVLRFGSFLQTIGPDGNWCNVDFNVSTPEGFSNIEEIGGNVFVRNRMAIGMDLSNVEVSSVGFHQQLHVEKTAENRYELALWDRTLQPWNRKVAVFGHGEVDAEMKYLDASMVIATGTPGEDYYNGAKIFKSLPELPQNIYFYPGQYEHSNVYRPLIRPDNPPVFGVFYNKTVGIGTFRPQFDFHVEGDAFVREDIYTRHPTIAGSSIPLAKFYQNNFIGRVGIPPIYAGAEYINAAAPRVGINTTPQYEYGLTVAGSLKLADGFLYTPQNQRVGLWLQGGNEMVYRMSPVGVGVSSTVYPLEIYETGTTRPTYLNIQANQVEVESSLNYSKGGVRFNAASQTWVAEAGIPYSNKRYVKQSFAIYDTRSVGSNVLLGGQYFSDGRHQAFVGDIYDMGDYGPSNSTYDDALIVGGNTTIFGSLKITSNLDVDGRLSLNGTYITINGSTATPVVLPANPNDILITGSIVHLLPKATNPNSTFNSPTQIDAAREAYVSVGYTEDTDLTLTQKSDYSTYPILRVHQYINSATIARFSSVLSSALIDFEAGRSGTDVSTRMRFGLDYNDGRPSLVFLDRTTPSQPKFFMRGVKQTNASIYTGFNIDSSVEPAGNLHIYNNDTASSMLLIQYDSTVNSSLYAPTALLRRNNTSSGASYQWTLKGPMPDSLQPTAQKLSFVYNFTQTGFTPIQKEVFTLLSSGLVGINNSSPNYALDMRCATSADAIRLYSPDSTSTGMILFQAGPSNSFGGDAVVDYRMYASNSGFYIDQQGAPVGLRRLMNFNSSGNLGILSEAVDPYAVNIDGYLNVTDGILINGFPFLYRQEASNVITGGLRVDSLGNIFINPVADFACNIIPSLVIGGGIAGCNLVHVYSGSNANMMVYDSIYEEAQVHFRTRSAVSGLERIHRVASSNHSLIMEYRPQTDGLLKIEDTHLGYVRLGSWHYASNGIGMSAETSNMVQLRVQGDMWLESESNSAEIRFPSGVGMLGDADTLRLRTSDVSLTMGTGVVSLDGRLGIGTTAAGASVDIVSVDTTAIRVSHLDPVDPMVILRGLASSNTVVVSATGSVGIGTTLPLAKLHVEGDMRMRSLIPTVGDVYDLGGNTERWRTVYCDDLNLDGFSVCNVAVSGRPLVAFKDTVDDTVSGRLMYPVWRVGEVAGGTVLEVSRSTVSPSNVVFVVRNSGETEIERWSPVLYSPATERVGFRTEAPSGIFHVLGGSNMVADGSLVASVLIESSNAAGIGAGALPLVSLKAPLVSNGVLMEVGETGVIGVGASAAETEAELAHLYVRTSASNAEFGAMASNVSLLIQQDTVGDVMRLRKGNSNVMIVNADGRVGIGTFLPTTELFVSGDIYATGTLTASNLNVINLNTTDVEITFSEQVSITNTGNDTALKIIQTGNAPMAEFQYGALEDPKTTGIVITSNAWVGIGTVTPSVPLEVSGKILYRNDYATSNIGLLPEASNHPAMVVGVADETVAGVWNPYVSKGASWNRLALFQDILDQIDDQRGLRFFVDDIDFVGSNVLMSGAGLFDANSNSPELYVYRGFTYRFSNVSLYDIDFTSNTGVEYVPMDLGIVHDVSSSNASPSTRYTAHTGEQVRLTIPMDTALGAQYRYQWATDSNVFGNINIV